MMLPTASTATPTGLKKAAATPAPFENDSAPLPASVLTLAAKQEDNPRDGFIVKTGQGGAACKAVAGQYAFGGHNVGKERPAAGHTKPTGHDTGTAVPPGQNVPNGQGAQALVALKKLPAVHDWATMSRTVHASSSRASRAPEESNAATLQRITDVDNAHGLQFEGKRPARSVTMTDSGARGVRSRREEG